MTTTKAELKAAGDRLAAWAARAEERWSGGDLAEAVRNLAHARQAWNKLLDGLYSTGEEKDMIARHALNILKKAGAG